jgi:DUF917 family protein
MKKVLFAICMMLAIQSIAQIKIGGKEFDLSSLLNGKVLNVQKGFAPKFSLGDMKLPKLNVLSKVLGSKHNVQIDKLFRTFKTGKTVWNVSEILAGLSSVYATVKNIEANGKTTIDQAARDAKDKVKNQATTGLVSALGSAAVGVVIKLLTKKASYKAVDLFNGVAKKKITDIFSIEPLALQQQYTNNYAVSSNNRMGMGIAIKLK